MARTDPTWTGTTDALTTRLLLVYASTRGHDIVALTQHFELDPSVLADPDGRLPLRTYGRVWEELPRLLDEPALPVQVGGWLQEVSRAATLPLPMLLTRSCSTLGEALALTHRYERLFFDNGESTFDIRVDGELAEFVVDPRRGVLEPPTAAIVFHLANFVHEAALTTGRRLNVRSVVFRHPEPADRRPFDEHFGVRVGFGAPMDVFVFAAEDLDRPQLTASDALKVLLARQADLDVTALPQRSALLASVRRTVRSRHPSDGGAMRSVARALGYAPRTLQRELAREGTTLRAVVDDVRRELAAVYLRDPTLGLVEIAFALGFSDQSAFHRAFARWYEVAPGQYRKDRVGRALRAN